VCTIGAAGPNTAASGAEFARVAAQDVVTKADCADHEMGIDHVRGLGSCEQATDGPAVVERMHGDTLEEGRQAGLARAIPPHLGHHRMCGVQCGAGSHLGGPLR
jgi:hypothetical protein